MTVYTPALLDPRPGAPNPALGPNTLGIEVTVPALAALCGLGNIDPQHGSDSDPATAACEVATEWPLPPPGTTLATIRPDADSFVAMAVLELRATCGDKAFAYGGLTPHDFGMQAAYDRVVIVAATDTERAGPWPGIGRATSPRALTEPAMLTAALSTTGLSPSSMFGTTLNWLTRGHVSREMLDAQVAAEKRDPVDGLVEVADGLAVVVSTHRAAIDYGYLFAPVVVATNVEHHWPDGSKTVKHTVARWNHLVPMDWAGMLADLPYVEPGWGGSSSICGSPQGIASKLSTEQVADVVRHRLGPH